MRYLRYENIYELIYESDIGGGILIGRVLVTKQRTKSILRSDPKSRGCIQPKLNCNLNQTKSEIAKIRSVPPDLMHLIQWWGNSILFNSQKMASSILCAINCWIQLLYDVASDLLSCKWQTIYQNLTYFMWELPLEEPPDLYQSIDPGCNSSTSFLCRFVATL